MSALVLICAMLAYGIVAAATMVAGLYRAIRFMDIEPVKEQGGVLMALLFFAWPALFILLPVLASATRKRDLDLAEQRARRERRGVWR